MPGGVAKITATAAPDRIFFDAFFVPVGCWLYGSDARDEVVMPDGRRMAIRVRQDDPNVIVAYQKAINRAVEEWIG